MDTTKIKRWKSNGGETMTDLIIAPMEAEARDAGLAALYLSTMRTIYAGVCLRNKERGGKISDINCVMEAENRFVRAWQLEKRMPAATANTDVLLVQILKDEIAVARVAKLVE